MKQVFVAVQSLRPNTEFVLRGDDVEGIEWHTPDVEPLTRAEVDAEIARLEQAAEQAAAEAQVAADAREAARVAAVAHARGLGFTDEMIAAMGLGGVHA